MTPSILFMGEEAAAAVYRIDEKEWDHRFPSTALLMPISSGLVV